MAEYSWLIDDIETLSTYTKDGYTRTVLTQAVKAIRKLSADVAPVRHGRWIRTDDFSDEQIDWVVCDRCKAEIPDFDYSYCPSCGAKMDGGET